VPINAGIKAARLECRGNVELLRPDARLHKKRGSGLALTYCCQNAEKKKKTVLSVAFPVRAVCMRGARCTSAVRVHRRGEYLGRATPHGSIARPQVPGERAILAWVARYAKSGQENWPSA
jgi:hypothetical protein